MRIISAHGIWFAYPPHGRYEPRTEIIAANLGQRLIRFAMLTFSLSLRLRSLALIGSVYSVVNPTGSRTQWAN